MEQSLLMSTNQTAMHVWLPKGGSKTDIPAYYSYTVVGTVVAYQT